MSQTEIPRKHVIKQSEIDRLVAENVMGWNEKEIIDMDDYPRIAICEAFTDTPFDFSPTTNIADAWLVVKKLNEKYTVDVRDTLNDGAECFLYKYKEETESLFHACVAEAETAPLAICLAALKAVGVEVEVLE